MKTVRSGQFLVKQIFNEVSEGPQKLGVLYLVLCIVDIVEAKEKFSFSKKSTYSRCNLYLC